MFRITLAVVAAARRGRGRPGPRAGHHPRRPDPGSQFRMVFVSSTTTDPTSGSISTYDTLVQNAAAAAGLDTYGGSPVAWLAIVSTQTVAANSRLTDAPGVDLYLVNGTKFFSGSTNLFWTASNPRLVGLNVTETGGTYNGSVWAGSEADGSIGTSGQYLGGSAPAAGNSGSTSSGWISANNPAASTLLPVYAFSEILVVPAAVPEPSSLAALRRDRPGRRGPIRPPGPPTPRGPLTRPMPRPRTEPSVRGPRSARLSTGSPARVKLQ
ncbi:MAG: hypothetical protein U0835_21680 [Isosphaeraceae bacterium]